MIFICRASFKIYLESKKTENTYKINSVTHTKLKNHQGQVKKLIDKLKNNKFKKFLEKIIQDSISYEPTDLYNYFNFKILNMIHLKNLDFEMKIEITPELKLPKNKELKLKELIHRNNPDLLLTPKNIKEHLVSCFNYHYQVTDSFIWLNDNPEVAMGEIFDGNKISKLTIVSK